MADTGWWASRVLTGRPGWVANVTAGGAMAPSGTATTGVRSGVRVRQEGTREAERIDGVGEAQMSQTAGVSGAPTRGARMSGGAGVGGAAKAVAVRAGAGRWAERLARAAMGAERPVGRRLGMPADAERAAGAGTVRSGEVHVAAVRSRTRVRGIEGERELAREERRMRVAVSR